MSDSVKVLSDDEVAGIEARPTTYYCNKCGWFGTDGPKHPNCNYHATRSPSDFTIDALCATVRALRQSLREANDAGGDLLDTNTALREQLARSLEALTIISEKKYDVWAFSECVSIAKNTLAELKESQP